MGEGKGRVCIDGSDWERLESGRDYTFEVEGTSVLFETTNTTSFTFLLESRSRHSSSLLSARQEISCDFSLWDASPNSIYGIQTYPSGHTLLPSSLRSSPLIITTKALSPCPQIGMSKDILASSSFFWEFINEENKDIDPNDWVVGTRLVIPQTILEDREVFPPNQPIELRVFVDVGEGREFFGGVAIEFMSSPVEMVVQDGFSVIYDVNDRLLIDFSNSYTTDGLVVGGQQEWIWEWEWSCLIPQEIGEQARECVYDNGEVVVMPQEDEGRFEGEEGNKFEEGVPLFFSVKGRVRERQTSRVVAEGTWSSVVNPVGGRGVGLEVTQNEWRCTDSSVGFQVLFLF